MKRIFIILFFITYSTFFVFSQPQITSLAGLGGAPGYNGDGPALTRNLNDPSSIVADGYGDYYFTDSYNYMVREYTVFDDIITIAGTTHSGVPESISQYIGTATTYTDYINSFATPQPATSAHLELPLGLALNSTGTVLYIADEKAMVIWKLDLTSSKISWFAGTGANFGNWWGSAPTFGVDATACDLSNPSSVAVDASGNVFIADQIANVIAVVDEVPGTIYGQTCGTVNAIYKIAGTGSGTYNFASGAATSVDLYWPRCIAIDNSGNLFISDTHNEVIRKVDPSGALTTFAGNNAETKYELGLITPSYTPNPYSGDGGAATSAELYSPAGITIDGSGNVFIADEANFCIREVDGSGIITTVVGNKAGSLAAYAMQQNAFSGDSGPATSAELAFPTAIALDPSMPGYLYITDFYNDVIRQVH